MTIDEAITHAREVAEENRKSKSANLAPEVIQECELCAQEHDQLAEWLEELKQYRTIGTPEECRAAVAVKREVQDIVDRLEELKEEKTIGSHKVMIKEAIEIVRGEADA